MNVNIFVSIICIISLILGAFLGVFIFKFYNRRIDKKILKNAEEVLDGKRKNKIIIDGQEHDATKFITRDKNNNKINTDLKGGGEIQNGKEKIPSEDDIAKEIEDNSTSRENSINTRDIQRDSTEKKRNSGARSRRRKFG